MQTNANTSVESHDVETWSAWASRANNAYIGFLTLTLVATVLIVVFNSRLNRAKDAAYGREKQASDERIAAANAGAAEANRKAAEANEGLAKSGEKIAALTKEAEIAKKERADADKQIAIAKADAARAKEGAEVAKADALRAKEGIASAEARSLEASAEVSRLQVIVANAEQKRAEAERALLELQQHVKHRRLTETQSADFVRVLRTLPNQSIAVGMNSGDDTVAFANQLIALFKVAGWTVRNKELTNHFDAQYSGVGLLARIPDPNQFSLTPLQKTLFDAFTAAGVRVQFLPYSIDDGLVEVLVGTRPEH